MVGIKDKLLKKKPKTKADLERDFRQLGRLQTLLDVVFALMILRVFLILPKPTAADMEGPRDLLVFLGGRSGRYEMVIVGIILLVVYWVQNNKAFGNLKRTDGTHAAMSIFQVFFLLIYLYFVRMGVEFRNDIASFFFQSMSLALVGFTAVIAWSYAIKDRRLISDSLTDREAREMRLGFMSEPLTALITIPFSWLGPLAWTLAWLADIPISMLLKRSLPKEVAEE
jgi:uncharacterized membrane protein